jgi:hypothetical protein
MRRLQRYDGPLRQPNGISTAIEEQCFSGAARCARITRRRLISLQKCVKRQTNWLDSCRCSSTELS